MHYPFSRRAVLLGLAASAGAALSAPRHAFASLDGKPFSFLTETEARLLAVLCDTLIPADDYPSASEAGVVDFIDLQMVGPYGRGHGLYMKGPFFDGTPEQGYQLPLLPSELIRAGLAGLERAESGFALMEQPRRDEIVTAMSEGEMDLGDAPSKAFFDEVWTLTNQGYFADPIYGGNADYAGWKMVGFPGAHAYYTSFVNKHNRRYPQPPMGINHAPGGNGDLPAAPIRKEP
ncbi:gluconate 2-dehydrogenase subunit 3 family protein [Roseovarius aquimarinus]|uniref:Gluconate 2-dehydrogenase subunit 3 family protein n=1 Tax=Roseovarius aquimarinus TaxID=1229156 RepID=A0ABW7I490_9RHOB